MTTSVEVPFSIACALPSLTVLDITNNVRREVAEADRKSGIAYISAAQAESLVRVNEREAGFFEDVETLLERFVPVGLVDREKLLLALLGPRTEGIPFADGQLCLGRWQRVLLFGFNGGSNADWMLTLVG